LPIALAVHGGAWNIPDDAVQPSLEGVRAALTVGWSAGRLAAATSTGGTQDKAAGRVGDTPIIGAGTYADDRFGAASATGWGEAILRVLLTKSTVDHLAAGLDVEFAADKALSMLDRVRGKGGLILVDRHGRLALRFNTPRMARAWATEAGGKHAAVELEEPAL
jgi:beta-aspartyl-peptidase (threonine type)